MKRNELLPLARLASSLSLFGVLLCMHITFTLAYFLPSGSKDAMYAVYFFFFAGIAAGAVLCPLFLAVPIGKQKPLFMSIGFITFLVIFEFTLRSLGFQVWLGSAAVRNIMAIPEGILTSACYGLFYLTWLRRSAIFPASFRRVNRTGGFCSLVFGAALLGSVLVRYYSVPVLESGIAAADTPVGAIAGALANSQVIFNFIKWCMLILTGLCAVICVILMRGAADESGKDAPAETAVKTDLNVILRLVGLAFVFNILNALSDMRALPLYSDNAIYRPNYLIVFVIVILLSFFAGRSTASFLRRFMFPALIVFILISCLPLFEDHPGINMIISTLLSIGHYTAWVVFTTAVVELYSGGFWFYGMSTVIFFTVFFAFLSPVIDPFVPDSAKFLVLYTVISSVLFLLLAFRWLIFPKLPAPAKQESLAENINIDDICRQHELTQREIEIANLLVKEGFGKNEIGERLFIAPGTAKVHISNIYQKFGVDNRAEFMALFVKGEKQG